MGSKIGEVGDDEFEFTIDWLRVGESGEKGWWIVGVGDNFLNYSIFNNTDFEMFDCFRQSDFGVGMYRFCRGLSHLVGRILLFDKPGLLGLYFSCDFFNFKLSRTFFTLSFKFGVFSLASCMATFSVTTFSPSGGWQLLYYYYQVFLKIKWQFKKNVWINRCMKQ